MDCSKDNVYLLLTAMATSALWILSEIIGSSKCRAGGVFEFMLYGYCVEVRRETAHAHPHPEPSDSSETSLLLGS